MSGKPIVTSAVRLPRTLFPGLALLVTLLAASLSPHAQIADPLPADVQPRTLNRLPPHDSGGVTTIDRIVAHGSGTIVRWEFAPGRALSELAILATAREHDQPYEWSLHELEALAVGLDPAVIEIVRQRSPVDALGETEAIIVRVAREIFGEHRLAADTYASALARLGTTDLVDLVMLMAEYAEDAVRLTAFNQHMPPGWRQFLPLPYELPNDIHEDSRNRLPYLRRETRRASPTPPLYGRGLAPEGTGPGQITRRIRSPEALQASIGPRLVRLARLIACRELDDEYQWTLNETDAANDGLDSGVIDVVRYRRPASDLETRDRILIEFGRELLSANRVSAATYAAAIGVFGEADLVDLVNLFATHAGEAALLTAFDQRLPAGQASLLPAL
jgi:4-carboxymuconolactone decarboxylase